MGRGKINLPNDYQYDNAKPGQQINAKTIFGLATELDSNFQAKGSRASYANWVASEVKPSFHHCYCQSPLERSFRFSTDRAFRQYVR